MLLQAAVLEPSRPHPEQARLACGSQKGLIQQSSVASSHHDDAMQCCPFHQLEIPHRRGHVHSRSSSPAGGITSTSRRCGRKTLGLDLLVCNCARGSGQDNSALLLVQCMRLYAIACETCSCPKLLHGGELLCPFPAVSGACCFAACTVHTFPPMHAHCLSHYDMAYL